MVATAKRARRNQRVEAAEARRRRILAEAERLLAERGYSGFSLNVLVRRAGGSKASIAKFFGNKAGLISTVMQETAQAFAARVARLAVDDDPEADLVRLSRAILGFFLLPGALMAYRAVVGEGHRERDMAAAFYRAARVAVVDAVAARLQHWQAAGRLQLADVQAAADRLTHLLRAGLHEQTLLGLRARPPGPKEIEASVVPAVQEFLRGALRR
jgi:TetR/AcrR family transcriptional repressor of mexJK operon